MKTIVFDENSMNWTDNPDLNIEYLKAKRAHIFTMFDLRGYMYLNQIYENFGINWNTRLVNCLYLATTGPLVIRYEPVEDGRILIHIS